MAEFGTPETWNMKVGDFIETELPKEKPQALLDLQEQNRKQRLLDSLQKIGPGLMDESLDFIRRENFARGSEKDLGSFIYKPEVQKEIKKLYDQGLSLSEIVDKTKYSRSTVKRVKNILGLETIFEKNKNTVENAIKKLKKEKGRNPTLAEMKRETGLNEKTINRNKGNITLSMGQKVGEFKGAGTAASAKMFKEKKVNKPTATNFDGTPGVKFKDKAQEKKYLEILEKKYDYPINSPEIKEINKKLMKDFGLNKFSLERINSRLAKQKGFEFPKKVYDPGSERDRQRIREKKRAEALKKTSDPSIERQIQKVIKSVNPKALAKDVDVAHRASLIANAGLGSDYLSTSLGIDKKIVNQKLVKPTEQKLGKLYQDQKKLIKGLKPGEVPKDIQKKIEKLNIKISELSDRTDGALQGVLVDEKTLKPSIYGIDYKKVLGAGLVEDKPLKEITKADLDLIKLNLPLQIESAKKFKPGMQPDGQLKDLPGGNEKGFLGGEKLAKAAGQKVLQALKVLGQPSIAAGFAADELRQGNIKTAGASLLAPELVGSLAPTGRGILSTIGRIAANPFGKAARAFTPVGLATIGAGALKDVYDEYKRREALTDEERLAEDLEAQEKFDEVMIGAAEGGRIGFADGPDEKGLKSPSRRKFLKTTGKLAGILALLPFGIGKGIMMTQKAAPVVAEGAKLGFDNFLKLVAKIKAFGKEDPARTTLERQKATTYTGKDGSEYELIEDMSTGDIRITRDKGGVGVSGDKSYDVIEDRSTFEFRIGQADETTKGKKPPDEYDEGKAVFDQEGTVADIDDVDDATIKAIEDEIN